MSIETRHAEIESLSGLSLQSLREAWRGRFKSAPPAYQSKALLVHAFAYRLQARCSSGLNAALRRQLSDLAARFAENSRFSPDPMQGLRAGSVLIRDWNGRRYGVTITDQGFLFEGARYPSLSAVAFAITGVKRSGPLFFKLSAIKDDASVNP